MAGRLTRAACEPVSPASLAAFRIIFGLLGLIAVVRFVANGWVADVYIEPVHHLTYTGFGWVQPWPAWGMYLHFCMLGLAGLGVALGYRYRLSIIAFFLLFTYLELIDQTTYLNHYYLVSLISFIMVFVPMARVASLDCWLRKRRSKNESTDERLANDGDHPTVPRSALWLLRAQLGLVYVFAGIAKLNADWLVEAQPLTIWLYNSTGTPLVGTFLREPWLPHVMSWAGAVFDLTIVGWLLWRRTRPYAYVLLVLFHLATALLFPAIGMFPWIMMGCALIFLDADWPERLLQRIRRKRGLTTLPPYEAPIARGATALSWSVRVAFLLVGLFLVLQVLLPLRHLAYPDNVQWSEEGYLFSWMVLVTEKMGLVRFRVHSSSTNGEVLVYPERYLTPTQAERAAYQPDLILATAHIIRDDFEGSGHQDVEVRVDAYVSYNGRPATRLIDPAVDLASVGRGIGPKHWVLPAPR